MRAFSSFVLALCLAICGPASADNGNGSGFEIELVAGDLIEPWGMAFLPDDGVLVTERGGRLTLIDNDGSRIQVGGLPEIEVNGQGGLLDVMVPRDFDQTREVFLSFSKPQHRGAGTALAVGNLSADGAELVDVRVIFEAAPGGRGGRHFGGRIVEAADGHIFLTIGERGDRPSAQDLSNYNGTVVRINRDGSVPEDNPFVRTSGVLPEIWSYGHRNPQGAALDLEGNLWINEHGARGGDEVNFVRRGANYGWPVIAYGRHYSGAKIGEGVEKPGMEQPEYYWDPSIAPSGMTIYSGKLFPEWRGDIFVGSLKFDYIARLDGDPLTEEQQINSPETLRVRDVREAPDGSIWFLSVGNGAVYRMVPEQS